MKDQLLETIVEPKDVLVEDLKDIKGGAMISCSKGKVKCKDGKDDSTNTTLKPNQESLSMW